MTTRVVRRTVRKLNIAAWVGDVDRLKRILSLLREASPEQDVEIVASERDEQFIGGDPEAVLDEMDRSSLVELKMSTDGGDTSYANVTFDLKKGVDAGAFGLVPWADATIRGLSRELERGRPYWWFMRTTWFSAAVSAVTVGPIAIGVIAAIDAEDRLGSAFVFLVVGWLVGAIANVGIRAVLPGFEVVTPGDRGKGARVLGIAVTVLAFVIGPYWSRLL